MSAKVRRAGKYIEIEFADAEITDVYGPERYGDGVIILSYHDALKLAKEILEKIMEMDEEGHDAESQRVM